VHDVPDLPLVSRRDMLRLGAVVAAGASLAACTTASNTGQKPGTSTKPTPGSSEDPDAALRTEVAAAEATLSTLYAELAGSFPAKTAATVAALGTRHVAYRAAVAPAAGPLTKPSATARAADPATALGRLRAAEKAAADARAQQSVRAGDSDLARVIALAGAGAAGAAEVLRGVSA
jgi:hypothetical protein